jgi:disulfide bond formation protein DsbB
MYHRFYLWAALLASVLSLAGALIAQYAFGLIPCELCMLQRAPYTAIIVLSALCLAWPRARKAGIWVVMLLFLVESGIAAYHAAVEKEWIQGPTACTSAPAHGPESLDDMLRKIQGAPIVACDQPAWEYHGVTMAGVNFVWSFALFIASAFYLRRKNYA